MVSYGPDSFVVSLQRPTWLSGSSWTELLILAYSLAAIDSLKPLIPVIQWLVAVW